MHKYEVFLTEINPRLGRTIPPALSALSSVHLLYRCTFDTPEHTRLMDLAGAYAKSSSPLERWRISCEMRRVRRSRRPSRPSLLTRIFAAIASSWADTPEESVAENLFPSPYVNP